MDLLVGIGKALAADVIQILAGCLLSVILLKLQSSRQNRSIAHGLPDWMLIASAAVFGILFPSGTFGIIPVAAAAYAAGLGCYLFVPAIISNTVFNMLIPFTGVGFIWKTILYRVLIALVIGVCSGFALKLLKGKGSDLIRAETVYAITGRQGSSTSFPKLANKCFGAVGPYLIAGVILDTIFMKYFFYSFINQFNIGIAISSVFSRFRGYDITTPVFLHIMILFNSLVSIRRLFALIALFKWKGILGYYLYFTVWALIIAVVNILF